MDWRKGIPIALTYCGAIVGAGFATGREVVEFFTIYGRSGLLGVVLASALLGVTGVVIIDIAQRRGVYSYRGLLEEVLVNPLLVKGADGIFALSLVVGAGVMAAAAAEILKGFVPGWLGAALFLGGCLLILSRGTSGFIKANTVLVPILTLIIVAICLMEIALPATTPLRPGPLLAAVLYVAFNTALAAVALSSLGQVGGRGTAIIGGMGGGLLTGSMLTLVYLATASSTNTLPQIPLSYFAQRWLGDHAWVYHAALLAAVMTTALANLHGLASRGGSQRGYFYRCLAIAGGGWIIARLGFGTLVTLLYPLLGYANLVLLGGLCYYVGSSAIRHLR